MRAVPGGVGYPRRYECTRRALEVLKGYSRRIACSCLCVFGCGGACSEASGAIATPASRPMRLCDAFSTKRLRLSHARASSVSTAVSAPRGSVRSQLRTSLWQAHQRQAARQGMASNGGYARERVERVRVEHQHALCPLLLARQLLQPDSRACRSQLRAVERRRVHSRTRLFGAADGRQPW